MSRCIHSNINDLFVVVQMTILTIIYVIGLALSIVASGFDNHFSLTLKKNSKSRYLLGLGF